MRRSISIAAVLLALGAAGVMTTTSAQPSEIPEFTAAEYPATLSATVTKATLLDAFGESFECEHIEYQGELASGPSPNLSLTPKFKGCTTSSGRFTTPTFTNCPVQSTVGATIAKHTFELVKHWICPEPEEKIHLDVYTNLEEDINNPNKPKCQYTVDSWTEETHLTTNTPGGVVELLGTTQVVTVTQTRNDPSCPEGTHTSEGKVTNTKPISVTAKNKSGKSIEFHVG